MLKLIYETSLIGKKDENEDAYLIKSFSNGDMLLAVADGMGGGVMGAELAQKSLELLEDFFEQESEYPLRKLDQALYMISSHLIGLLNGEKGGTTLCVAYYHQKEIFYINIGDSRVWLCREGKIINITLDQNRYEYRRLKNDYTDEEDKRLIHRAVGISSSFELEGTIADERWSAFGSFRLEENDLLFLSSDGFHDYIESEHFCDELEEDFEGFMNCVEDKSHDNITVLIAKEVL